MTGRRDNSPKPCFHDLHHYFCLCFCEITLALYFRLRIGFLASFSPQWKDKLMWERSYVRYGKMPRAPSPGSSHTRVRRGADWGTKSRYVPFVLSSCRGFYVAEKLSLPTGKQYKTQARHFLLKRHKIDLRDGDSSGIEAMIYLGSLVLLRA